MTTYRQHFELRYVSNMYLSSRYDNIRTAIRTTLCEQYVFIVMLRQHTDSNLNYVMWAICICRHATTTYRQQFDLRYVSNMYLSSRDDNIQTAIWTTLCEQYVSVVTRRQHTDSNMNYVMWAICICRHATTYRQQYELRYVSNMYLSSLDNIQTDLYCSQCCALLVFLALLNSLCFFLHIHCGESSEHSTRFRVATWNVGSLKKRDSEAHPIRLR